MKRVFFAVSLVALVLLVGVAYSQRSDEKVRVMVKWKEGESLEGKVKSDAFMDKEKAIQILRKKYGSVRQVFPHERALSMEISKADLASLKKDALIEEVQELRQIRAFLQDSRGIVNATPTWGLQRGGVNITGSGETICIIDTGVNFTHPDLQGKNATNCTVDCVGKPCIFNCTVSDDHGHGTHVAGIVGANGTIKGIAPDALIVAVKVLDASGSGDEADLKAGIDFCVSNSSAYNISVISMSLGTDTLYASYCDANYSGTPNLTKSVNDAIQKNISVIAATGNNASIGSIAAPACIRNATAVASSTKSDGISSFSNRNNITDLIAPGSSINSTLGKSLGSCSTQGSYMVCSGTSMATPHVAAAFALLRQFKRLESNKILSPGEIENALKNTGKNITDTNGLNFSRIDIYAATQTLQNPSVSLVSPANGSRFKNPTNFTCNASTDSQSAVLANMTFFLYNTSSSLIYNETKNVSGASNQSAFNYTFSLEQNYFWWCRASDNRSYLGSSGNFTVIYDATALLITIVSPVNTTYKDGLFNVSTNENASWCSYSLDHAGNVSMTKLNDTYFNFSLTNIAEGIHNASFSCNDTAGNFNSTALRQFTINRTLPLVVLLSPDAGYSANQGAAVDFRYNVTHGRNISSCSLMIDDLNVSLNASVNTSIENNFSFTPSSGYHTWNINCTDDLGNIGNASSRSFTINAPSLGVAAAGGGGGGGSVQGGVTYTLGEKEITRGANKEVKEDDRIKFILLEQGKNVTHYINITNVTDVSAVLVIYSQPKIFSFKAGESKKIELTGDNYYDLFLQLNNITNKRANVTVRLIHEQIPSVRNESRNETRNESRNESAGQKEGNATKDTGMSGEPKGREIQERNSEKTLRLKRMVILSIVVLLILAALWNHNREKKKK